MYSPERVLDISEEDQQKVIFALPEITDLIDLLSLMSSKKLLTEDIHSPDTLREVFNSTIPTLMKMLEEENLPTDVTLGQAIWSLYKAKNFVTFQTSQRFVVERKKMESNPYLSSLVKGVSGNVVKVPEDSANSSELASILKNFSTYYKYLEACHLEDDMRANMYVTKDKKYYQPHFGLIEIDNGFLKKLKFPTVIRREPEEKFTDNILFPYSRLCRRPQEEKDIITDYLDSIIGEESNIFIAGGAVFSALFKSKTTDIDLFIHGVSSEEAMNIVRRMVEKLKPENVMRTENSITLMACSVPREVIRSNFTRRERSISIQLILRLYNTPSEILHGFDVDSCCVGYDGKKFWATERALHSLKYSTNTVNFGRLSPSYEYRLSKYATRGLMVYVPDLQSKRVNKEPLARDYLSDGRKKANLGKDVRGLSILLYYNEKSDPSSKREKLPVAYKRGFIGDVEKKSRENSDYSIYAYTGITLSAALIFAGEDPEDAGIYEDISINSVTSIDRQPPSGDPITFIKSFTGDLESILEIDDTLEELIHRVAPESELRVPREVEWKTTNPGEQMTNTFHQIVLLNNEEWYKGKYYSSLL